MPNYIVPITHVMTRDVEFVKVFAASEAEAYDALLKARRYADAVAANRCESIVSWPMPPEEISDKLATAIREPAKIKPR